MFDPRSFEGTAHVSEPTPAQKYREEYYTARSHTHAPAKQVNQSTVDVELLRAQFVTRVSRFLRFA